MAEIPVERKTKSSFPLWLIPLLLLLLLLPFFYFLCGRADNAVVVDNTNGNRAIVNANNNLANAGNMTANGANAVGSGANSAVGANAANSDGNQPAGRTIEAVNFFGTTADKQSLVGRGVSLRAARVDRVLSDRVFTVKSENEEMFVMLDESLDSGGGKEKQIRVRRGQNVRLAGSFRAAPTEEVKEETQGGGLNQKEYAQMKGQKVYLHATEIGNAP